MVAACAVPVAGCREELGPETFRTTVVSGVVRNGGRPVAGGWIEFHPIDSAVGNLRAVPIGPDGSFRADRVPVGPNIIQLTAVRTAPGRDSYLETSRLSIRRAISDGPNPPLVIDVLEERVRQFKDLSRGH
jgi:hypothetical protein